MNGRPPRVGWDAIPEALVSLNVGSNWLKPGRTAFLTVPSVIIDEEDNVMVNPAHPDSARIGAAKVRRFPYDHRVWLPKAGVAIRGRVATPGKHVV